MAMMCLEEPLCPNSPVFKPCRFLNHPEQVQQFTMIEVYPHQKRPSFLASIIQKSQDDLNKKSKKSILSFLIGKRKLIQEKNLLK